MEVLLLHGLLLPCQVESPIDRAQSKSSNACNYSTQVLLTIYKPVVETMHQPCNSHTQCSTPPLPGVLDLIYSNSQLIQWWSFIIGDLCSTVSTVLLTGYGEHSFSSLPTHTNLHIIFSNLAARHSDIGRTWQRYHNFLVPKIFAEMYPKILGSNFLTDRLDDFQFC